MFPLPSTPTTAARCSESSILATSHLHQPAMQSMLYRSSLPRRRRRSSTAAPVRRHNSHLPPRQPRLDAGICDHTGCTSPAGSSVSRPTLMSTAVLHLASTAPPLLLSSSAATPLCPRGGRSSTQTPATTPAPLLPCCSPPAPLLPSAPAAAAAGRRHRRPHRLHLASSLFRPPFSAASTSSPKQNRLLPRTSGSTARLHRPTP
jgi:hypothetical protein